jgi:hypothetical protein
MTNRKTTALIFTSLLVLGTFIGISPKITAGRPPPSPTDHIADIFPQNNNTNVQLLNVSTTITINATDFLNEIEVTFNGTYTLFNPGIPINLNITLPMSLHYGIENTTFEVSVNATQIPFEIATSNEVNLTSLGLNPNFVFLDYFYYPITLITSNITLLENTTYIVKYQFYSVVPKPNYTRCLFYMLYSSYTSYYWKGNATEKVDFIVYGRDPYFELSWNFEGLQQTLDIVGGKRFTAEWENAQNREVAIGMVIDEHPPLERFPNRKLIIFIGWRILFSTQIGIFIWVIIWQRKGKL